MVFIFCFPVLKYSDLSTNITFDSIQRSDYILRKTVEMHFGEKFNWKWINHLVSSSDCIVLIKSSIDMYLLDERFISSYKNKSKDSYPP